MASAMAGRSVKDMVKLGCKNAKLFLTEPLIRIRQVVDLRSRLIAPECASHADRRHSSVGGNPDNSFAKILDASHGYEK
jgi:hypothetical protein